MIYSLQKAIQGENLKRLIQYLLEHSSYFSLTMHEVSESEILRIKQNAFFRDEMFTNKWFSYITYEKPLQVMLFQSDTQMTDFILGYFSKGLFELTGSGVEDICFFAEDGIMFGSVTHEKIAHLFVNEQEMRFLNSLGDWKQVEYMPRDYEFIPKEMTNRRNVK